MTLVEPTIAELEAIASIVERAEPGEQLEAYVARGGETEIRIYEGEIENFVSAQSEGIGVRIIRDGRTGFAYAGTLDRSAVDEVIAEARDNLAFGTVDEWAGLADTRRRRRDRPAAVERRPRPVRHRRKIELAKDLERRTLAGDPRIRVDDSNYADSWTEFAVATTTGIRRSGRANGCYVQVSTLADDGDETQTGFGFSVGRNPDELDLVKAAADGVERATRLLGATKPPSRRLTVVLDPFVTAQFLGIIGADAERRERREGPQPVPRPTRRDGRRARRDARRRPHQPAGVHRDRDRRRGPRRPSQRADRRRRAPAVRPLQLLGPTGRHRVDRQCRARRVRQRHRRRLPRPVNSCPGRGPRTRSSPTSTTACS